MCVRESHPGLLLCLECIFRDEVEAVLRPLRARLSDQLSAALQAEAVQQPANQERLERQLDSVRASRNRRRA